MWWGLEMEAISDIHRRYALEKKGATPDSNTHDHGK
jgi:hypothetical protein